MACDVIRRVRSFCLPAAIAVIVAVPVWGQGPPDLIFADGSSTQKSVDVSAYANGGAHVLEFRGVFEAAGTSFTNFMVDDVRLESCP